MTRVLPGARKAVDFFVTTPYNKIPKEYLSDFKKCRELVIKADKEKDSGITLDDKKFIDKTFEKIQKATGLSRSKEDDEACAYSDVLIASDAKANLNRSIFSHDNNSEEVRADLYVKIKDPSIDIERDLDPKLKPGNRARKQNVDELLDDDDIKKKAKKYMK